jgi:hypothetical protein
VKVAHPCGRVIFAAVACVALSGAWADDPFTVPHGQLTFDAEGTEGGPYHSRRPHVPTDTSGLTIGRGYDMKERSASQITSDLTRAGVPEATAKLYAGAAHLSGAKARDYIKTHNPPEITPAQQKALFAVSYDEAEADVRRICEKADVVAKYGKTDWGKLIPAIKDILVDLRFRGDYTPKAREHIQKLVVANDLKGLASDLSDRSKWSGVPQDRFDRRRDFARKALGS